MQMRMFYRTCFSKPMLSLFPSGKTLSNYVRKLHIYFCNCHTSKPSKFHFRTYNTAFVNPAEEKNDSEDEKRKEFDKIFPLIVNTLAKDLNDHKMHEVADWFTGVLQYNVPLGEATAMAIVKFHKLLEPNASPEKLHISRIVGCCYEMNYSYLALNDDILDKNLTRNGRTSWYLQPNVGMRAITDSLMLNTAILKILFQYVEDKELFFSIVECFNKVMWLVVSGQCLDLLSTQNSGRPDLNKYTHERYALLAKYKSAYFLSVIQVLLSFIVAGKKHVYTSSVEDLLLTIGCFLQTENDFVDCFGNMKTAGKIGTDIKEGKNCWPIVTALKMVNSEEREILQNNYGVQDEESCQRVKDIYKRIGLKDVFAVYQKETYSNICKQIEVVSKEGNIPKEIFYEVLQNQRRI